MLTWFHCPWNMSQPATTNCSLFFEIFYIHRPSCKDVANTFAHVLFPQMFFFAENPWCLQKRWLKCEFWAVRSTKQYTKIIKQFGAYVVLGLRYCMLGMAACVGLLWPAVGHSGPMLEPFWVVMGVYWGLMTQDLQNIPCILQLLCHQDLFVFDF